MYVSISQAKQDGNEYMMLACSCLTDNLLHQDEFLILLFAEQSKAKQSKVVFSQAAAPLSRSVKCTTLTLLSIIV